MGKKYQFRVVAVTKAGESDPSQETKPHLCRYKNLSPSIDQGSGGSKMVKLNRMATFQIKARGEPRATFSWLKEGQKLSSSEGKRPGWSPLVWSSYRDNAGIVMSVSEHPDPAEQSSVVILQIVRSQMTDAGKYSLLAENKNGSDRVDLDLIVIDEVPVCDCDMFLNGNLECGCHIRFRTETSDQEMARMAPSMDPNNEKK